jgi:hypothetical protein
MAGLRKTMKNLRIVGVPAENRKHDLPRRYRYANMLLQRQPNGTNSYNTINI